MLKKYVLLWIFVIFFPYICCVIAHLVNPKVTIGQGGYMIENHRMGKDIMLEINGIYKSIDVEEYVAGVMPGVISADYNMEALKTQAVLIRTNILKEMEENNTKDAADISYKYYTKEERRELWGRANIDKYERKIEKAVSSTAGKVIRKESSLIMALYHEVSIGKTADAAEVLDEDISYLKSVDSSRDVEAKNYMNIYTYTWDELSNMLVTGSTEEKNQAEESNTESPDNLTVDKIDITIEESTENGFVKKVSVDGTVYTGSEAAEIFKLPSINYYVENLEDGVRFVCLGKGNCLGVSQYGANCMAANGKTMEDIISYYYKDVSIEEAFSN